MKKSVVACRLMLLGAVVGLMPAAAGTLERFEEGATKPAATSAGVGRSSSRSGSHHHGHSSLGEALAEAAIEGFIEGMAYAIAYGGMNSIALLHPETWDGSSDYLRRETGDAVIPYVTLEGNFQDVEGDVAAWDYRAEIGYAFLALSSRRTFYRESDSDFDLDTIQTHGLYRMTFGDSFEIDMGFGALELKGREDNVGFSFALPMRLHLKEGLGVEYRPVWSTIDENRIYDNDLALVLGWRYGYIRAGYRWFYHSDESLTGPQVGVSFRW